jgi:hypothetical protein
MDNAVQYGTEAGVDPRLLLAVLMAEVANSENLGIIDDAFQWAQVRADSIGVYSGIKDVIGRVTGWKEGEAGSAPTIGWGNIQEATFNKVKGNHLDVFGDVSWTDMIQDDALAIQVVAYRLADAQALAEATATPSLRAEWSSQELAAAIFNVGDAAYLSAVEAGGLGPNASTYATTIRRYTIHTNYLICTVGRYGCG